MDSLAKIKILCPKSSKGCRIPRNLIQFVIVLLLIGKVERECYSLLLLLGAKMLSGLCRRTAETGNVMLED